MALNPYYTAGILATIAALCLLLSRPPRNYPIAYADKCTARLSFSGDLRYEPNSDSGLSKTECELSNAEYQLIDTALILAYSCGSISLITLVQGLQDRKNRLLGFFVVTTTLLQVSLFCTFVGIVTSLEGSAGAAVYLQALIAAFWVVASIWHVCNFSSSAAYSTGAGGSTKPLVLLF
tara:strand:- start:83 stop:616 length:534 start_codon:yes stop_codon:yes gene_type:complete